MKVLFYNHTGQVSGAERVLMMILNGLDREAYQPVVVCPPASKMMEVAANADLDTLPLAQLEARFTWRLDRLVKYLWSFVQVIRRARELVKEQQPGLIHANSIRAGLVMSAATIGLSVPVIWHAHDILPRHPLSTLVRGFALLRSRNHILAVSQAVEIAFRGLLLRPFKNRVPITVIHNAVDLDRFRPDVSARSQMRSVLNLPADQSVVGIVGQLTPRKGQLDLIRAFQQVVREIPGALLLIVGEALFNRDEDYEKQLRDAVNRSGLNDNVRFLGSRDDIPRLLQALDVLVVNSHQEPFALTVLEGLASAIPVVATAVGGTPEMVQHELNGWLVRPGQDEELSAALVGLLRDRGLRSRLAFTARENAIGRYSIGRYLNDVDSLYRGIFNDCEIPEPINLPGLQLKVGLD